MKEPFFTTVHLESFVPVDHPLRAVKALLDEAMKNMSWLFSSIYADCGRESIPPERLMRAQSLQIPYSIRSERELLEQINYNLLYRWFVGLTIDDTVWNHSRFTTNRGRLLKHEVIGELFEEVVRTARKKNLPSDEHFSVDGTLIQAWASLKSYRRKDDDEQPLQVVGAMQKPIFMEKSAAMRLMSRRQKVKRRWQRRTRERKPNCHAWAIR